VQLVRSRPELEVAVRHVHALKADALVEEYLCGPEVDVDLCFFAGRCVFASVSDNFESVAPFFMETGCACPSTLPDADDAATAGVNVVTAVAGSTGAPLVSGVFHVEMKKARSGKWITVEVNPR